MIMNSFFLRKLACAAAVVGLAAALTACKQQEGTAVAAEDSTLGTAAAQPVCGGGAADEDIDFSENAVFIESIAIYEAGVKITGDNRLLTDFGTAAEPIKELAFKAAKSPFEFAVIGRDTKGRYVELPNDRHTCVGWMNSEDFSEFVEIGADQRSLVFKNVHPEIMTLIVSYQTVPGSSTPVQARLEVSNYPDRLR